MNSYEKSLLVSFKLTSKLLVNLSLTSFSKGIFPEKLKIVKVIPIHKGGSTHDINNFRPISLLSIFDKIIEKIMHKRLYDFLEHH